MEISMNRVSELLPNRNRLCIAIPKNWDNPSVMILDDRGWYMPLDAELADDRLYMDVDFVEFWSYLPPLTMRLF